MTVSADEEAAYVEIDSGGAGEIAEALERLPAVAYGMATPSGAPGTTLALQVASQVARAHGGRLSASARVGQGERFVVELPGGEGALGGGAVRARDCGSWVESGACRGGSGIRGTSGGC